jgi:hypothetical protein
MIEQSHFKHQDENDTFFRSEDFPKVECAHRLAD